MRHWDEKAIREAFTEDAVRLGAAGERFVVFPDEGKALVDAEYDGWLAENGFLAEDRRYAFLPLRRGGKVVGYALNALGAGRIATTLTAPIEAFAGTADEAAAAVAKGLET